ncbi:MAG TPA: ABC-F family ATP-binding cassette domain-containing protein [Planctomycetaceae bacterium]|nr:ABC-F family ATP-binding cassette domain-containing protein [Planctomycetaceae bacterium]
MILLTAHELTRQFDAEPVFENVSFDIRPGEKVGLVGPNGVGKSTLMRILAGLDEPDSGRVDRHPATQLEMLQQQTEFAPERTLIEEARSGLGSLYGLQQELLELTDEMARESDEPALQKLHRRYDAIQHELERHDAYNIDHRVDEVLLGLGFSPEQYDQPMCTLSGGQQNRALLARLLLAGPNLLLLDEPTNHLDIATTEWLEQYLARSPEAMIVVSHDRYFLDRVTNRILELSRRSITDYSGNFSAYWNQRAERMVVQQRAFEKQQAEIADMEDFIRRNQYGQKHAQATDREKKLARLERIERPTDFSTVPMGFGKASRTGDHVIEALDVSKGFGFPLFQHVTLRIRRGERVGIFGPNGSGKTTLLRTLLGECEPDSGEVRFGTGVQIGYFDQQLNSVDPQSDLIEAIRPPKRPEITPAQLRDVLARFGLKGEIVFQQVDSLSGGERSKVALARLAILNINFLVLDEPTNHLDFWACEALENSLREFDGTVLFVSHDRFFIDRVATQVIAFEPERVRDYEGNYSAYQSMLELRRQEQAEQAARSTKAEADRKPARRGDDKPKRKRRFPYRKVEDIEADIAEKEALVEKLQADLVSPEVLRDGQLARQTMTDYEATKAALAQLYEHWEEAMELA